MGISFSGIGSGIDSESLITSLVAAEKQPETAMQTAQSNLSSQISTLGTLVTQLQAMGTAASALNTANEIQAPTATSSNSNIGVSADATAAPGTYRLIVHKLAMAQSTASTVYNQDVAGIAGTGSVSIGVGTAGAIQVNYDSNDTLDDIASRITSTVPGVTASVVNDGTGFRVVVTSNTSGTAGKLTFSETGSGLGMTAAGADVQPAQDASFSLNGLEMTRSSNSITDVIKGVTLSLQAETPAGGSPTTVSISTDTTTLQSRAQSILDAYNKVVKTINGQLNYTGKTLGANTLFGDSTVQGLQLGLGTLAAQSYTYGPNPTDKITGADLGITIGSDGTLSLDSTKFAAALAKDPLALQHLLVGDGSKANGGFVGALNNTVTNYTQFGTGILITEQGAKQSQIKSYDTQIAAIDDRANSLETTLRTQFTALDSVMANYKSQQSYLTSLFASATSRSG